MGTDKKIKKIIKKNIIVFTLALALIGIIIVISIKNAVTPPPEAEIISSSTLEKILEVSELSTYEAVYIGVADVMNEEEPDNVDYHVYYESKIRAGINFEEVTLDVNTVNKIITVTLPEIKITDINVDITSLDYIFVNDKANTSTVSEEAYKACIADVTAASEKENALYDLAKENAINVIEALVSPFVDELDEDYLLEII